MQKYKVTVDSEGTKFWYLNGNLHRTDGPAVEFSDGGKEWWFDDKLHREDGPACEWADGTKYWWVDGIEYSESEFNAKMNSGSCEGREF